MSDNDTPRTDALHHRMYREHAAASKDGANFHGLLCVQYGHTKEALAHAGTLERELAAARAELAEARECLRDAVTAIDQAAGELGCTPKDLLYEKTRFHDTDCLYARWRKAAGVEG